jgi:4-amino-4-deoxy-L-arabinose transferase-like glycosyltransferase
MNADRESVGSQRRTGGALLAVIAIGLALRLWAIGYDLPNIYHPDEPVGLRQALMMLHTGDPNPHFFGYGSLFFYLNALADLVYYLLGKAIGTFERPTDIAAVKTLALGVARSSQPGQVVANRLVSILAGTLCIPVAFGVGRRLGGAPTGLLAALFVAVSPTLVLHSVFVTPNSLAALMALLTLLFLLRLEPSSRWPAFAAVGVALGCAIASKYNDAALGLSCLLALLLLFGRSAWRKPHGYVVAAAATLTFVVVTPYAVLDARSFLGDTLFHLRYYRVASHPSMAGNAPAFYALYLLQTHGALAYVGLGMVGVYLRRRSPPGLILASFAVPYLVYISTLHLRSDRTVMLVVPVLLIMAAEALVLAWWRCDALPGWRRLAARWGIACFVALSTGYMAGRTTVQAWTMTTPDAREVARKWIVDHVPLGAGIAAEWYGPFIDPGEYRVRYFDNLAKKQPEWYLERGFMFLVASSDVHAVATEPDSPRGARYEALLARFPVVAEFERHGRTIRILRTR